MHMSLHVHKGQKKSINFFDVNSVAPPYSPNLGIPETNDVPHILRRNEKRK